MRHGFCNNVLYHQMRHSISEQDATVTIHNSSLCFNKIQVNINSVTRNPTHPCPLANPAYKPEKIPSGQLPLYISHPKNSHPKQYLTFTISPKGFPCTLICWGWGLGMQNCLGGTVMDHKFKCGGSNQTLNEEIPS